MVLTEVILCYNYAKYEANFVLLVLLLLELLEMFEYFMHRLFLKTTVKE